VQLSASTNLNTSLGIDLTSFDECAIGSGVGHRGSLQSQLPMLERRRTIELFIIKVRAAAHIDVSYFLRPRGAMM
jgi:hypothetical protein